MKQKIQNLLQQLNHGLVERENVLKAALLTVLAGENLLLLGPPGTGKSMVARRIAESLSLSDDTPGYFEYLLTKFSTPEEIFGPLSIAQLKADRLKRNTTSYLPSVRFAFLDEIFKASSSILNALLTILNERIYHNGAVPEQVPLQSLIAASNELPADQEELAALYDRFLVRVFVDYVSAGNFSRLFERTTQAPSFGQLSVDELEKIRLAAESVTLPSEIIEAIQRIWMEFKEQFKEDRRENLSDRRLKKIIKLISVSAATNGRQIVDLSDVLLLKDCLWNHPENAAKTRELILKILSSFSQIVPIADGCAIPNPLDCTPPVEAANSSAQSLILTGKMNALIQGYKGKGTQTDPILIENLHDLAGLARPEVGQQGYHFKQTTDIDCSAVAVWPGIIFIGHYDGQDFSIKYRELAAPNRAEKISKAIFSDEVIPTLFVEISAESILCRVHLEALALTEATNSAHINGCSSNRALITGQAKNSRIIACEALESLIGHSASTCVIAACKSQNFLVAGDACDCEISQCYSNTAIIKGNASRTSITDCEVFFDLPSAPQSNGGIASTLREKSIVERCFVGGKIGYKKHRKANFVTTSKNKVAFCGIAETFDSSTIRDCALGKIELGESVSINYRIASPAGSNQIFDNNISSSTNPSSTIASTLTGVLSSAITNSGVLNQKGSAVVNQAKVAFDGANGQTVDITLMSQPRYFRDTLGWDFNHIWDWNDVDQHPTLRAVGVQALTQQQALASTSPSETRDLFTQQVRANIWL